MTRTITVGLAIAPVGLMNRSSFIIHHSAFILLCAALAAVLSPAQAQQYPTRPVRFIAPFPPAGTSDILCRIIGQKLTEAWGQQVVVDSRPGAAGSVGTEIASKATPDGYTMLLGNLTPVAINPIIYPKVGYDTLRDFAPVTLVAAAPQLLVVHPGVPAKSVKELIGLAKAKPGALNYGSGGSGTLAHLGAEMFKTLTAVNMVHISYKGTILSINDLLGGQVQLVFSDMPIALPHAKTGRLRALAVTGARPTPLVPGTPTVADTVPGFVLENWWGILVPKGTPAAIVAKLNTDIKRALELADVKERYANLGVEPVSSTPQQLADHIKSESAKFSKVIKAAGAKFE
jgi:tripartite-type tricarboxylate transporter receptor subunit TctC